MPGTSDGEAAFSRNDDTGQLTQRRAVEPSDRDVVVHLTVDGDPNRRVPKAVVRTDPQGNAVLTPDGSEAVRYSTVLDAVGPGCVPTLCHKEHLNPVGVCRVCVVALADLTPPKGGKEPRPPALAPACQHPLFKKSAKDETGGKARMAVHTLFSPDGALRLMVRRAVTGVFELLAGDHVHPESPAPRSRYHNELIDVAEALLRSWDTDPPDVTPTDLAARDRVAAIRQTLLVRAERPAARYGGRDYDPRPPRVDNRAGFPFVVDRNNCVLCDRCVRACGEHRPFRVIGRAGKGGDTRIAFDRRDLPMADSTCRACGECMTACPTGAITFREPLRAADQPPPGLLPAALVRTDAVRDRFPFLRQVPLAFLEWNSGAVRERRFQPGHVLAEQGEFATKAFVVVEGALGVYRRGAKPHDRLSETDPKWLTALQKYVAHGTPMWVFEAHPTNLVGEMSPMSHDRRLASLVGLAPGKVLEIDRNILHVLLRDPARRHAVDAAYKRYAILDVFDRIDDASRDDASADLLYGGPDPGIRESLAEFVTNRHNFPRLCLERYEAGQVVCAEGEDPAAADPRHTGVFLIRLGFVGVTVARPDGQHTLLPMSRSHCVGDLAVFSAEDVLWTKNEWERPGGPRDRIPDPPPRGVRAATCAALEHCELVRIPTDVFRAWVAAARGAGHTEYLRERCVRIWQRRRR